MADNRDPRRRSTEEIKRSMIAAKAVMVKESKKEDSKSVKYAKNALIFIGTLEIIVGLYEAYGPLNLMLGLYIDGGIGVSFIGLYFYSKEKPVEAFTVALIIYIAIFLLMAFVDLSSIFSGIILKIIIISSLFTGLKAAKKIPKVLKETDDVLDQFEDL